MKAWLAIIIFISIGNSKFGCKQKKSVQIPLQAYIGKLDKDTFSFEDFQKQDSIKLTNDFFTINSCTIYLKEETDSLVKSSSLVGNSLKFPSFVRLINSSKRSFHITFDDIRAYNKAKDIRYIGPLSLYIQ